jgi:membrane fusion protein (multidrug efflux system)
MGTLMKDQNRKKTACGPAAHHRSMQREFHRLIKRNLFITGLLFVMGFVITGCGENNASNNDGAQFGGRDGQGAAAIPVQVAPVKRGEISLYIMQTTTIEAKRQVEILAKVSGQVIKLPAEEGVIVKTGDLLAKLDEDELGINFMQTQVAMETDKSMFERAKNMLEKDLIAEEAYETTRLQYQSSKAAYEAARLQLEYTNIRAPFSGVVTARNIELGQRVNANTSLFMLADFDPLRAKIYVPEKQIGRIFVGQTAKITVEAQPGVEFSGVVQMVSPVVDPTSGTSKITIDINENKGKLKPGMFATVFITTDTHNEALIIQKKSLILESDRDQVYIYQEGKAHKVTLQTGFATGENLEVLSGLNEGDLVVTAGQDGLREGLPIRIPDETKALTRADEEAK